MANPSNLLLIIGMMLGVMVLGGFILIKLFYKKVSQGQAIKMVSKTFTAQEVKDSPREFKEEVMMVIGKDFNGYLLDDIAIDIPNSPPPP